MPSPALFGLEHKVIVGIADVVVANNPSVVLSTYSLGSCIGVSLYDPVLHVGGLLHIMLPDSSIEPVKAARQPAMFMDTGLRALFEAAQDLGADPRRVILCAAGGAQVMDTSGFFSIGKRNYDALLQMLRAHGFRLHAEQVGGMVSRSMFLRLETGEVRLKVSGQPNEVILCKSSTTTSTKSNASPPLPACSPSC